MGGDELRFFPRKFLQLTEKLVGNERLDGDTFTGRLLAV